MPEAPERRGQPQRAVHVARLLRPRQHDAQVGVLGLESFQPGLLCAP